ncbi:MAG: hydroxyacylglutathione hydrolase [Bdellovibrionia bacterium]
MNDLEWIQIPALTDNYSYVLADKSSGVSAVIDPSEFEPVDHCLEARGIRPQFIFNTHHHWDHVGGNLELKQKYGSKLVTSAYDRDRVEGSTDSFDPSRMFTFGNHSFSILEIPGHTLGHVALWFQAAGYLFSGDTLFALGCGRLFEGSATQMWSSLSKMAALPDETLVLCAHEYTLKNSDFALALEPENLELKQLRGLLAERRSKGLSTVPTRLGHEKRLNPFLRCSQPAFKELLGLAGDTDPVEVFAHVRRLKDKF